MVRSRWYAKTRSDRFSNRPTDEWEQSPCAHGVQNQIPYWRIAFAIAVTAGFASHSLLGQGKSPRPDAAVVQPSVSGAAGAPSFNPASSNTAPVEQGEAATTLSGERIIVRREAIALIDPRTYRIGFHLEPYRSLEIIAPQDGFIVGVQIKVNDRVESQYELIRFDDRTSKLHLDRAKAAQKIAQIKLKMAESNGDADSKDLAKAELELADAEFEIAKQNFDRAIIRAPFGGEVLEVSVVPGQFVRAGDRLLTIADNSKLKVEVPWERTSEIDIGKTIPLKVEERTVDATIESLKPLSDRFTKLRDLANSVTSLMLIIDNPARDGKTPHFVGQSVFPPLIPRHVVTEIPTRGVLSDKESGERKVQVLRDLAIRDISVQILGAVGPDRVFISGPFQEKDELILECSVELSDGTQLRPYVGTTQEAEQTVQKKSKSPDRSPEKSSGPRF